MNFNPTQKGVRVKFTDLKHEFDVRADGTVDENAAVDMALLGKIANTVVFRDLVTLDGRTGAVAQLIRDNTIGDPDATILVDILDFAYSKLSSSQKAEAQAEALRRNYPTREGFRRLATDADCIQGIENLIHLGRTKTQIAELMPFLGSRFVRQYDLAKNTITQQKIAMARQLMKDEHLTDLEAAKRVGLDSSEGIVSTTRTHDKAFNALKKKQAAIQKAVAAVTRYATTRLDLLRGGKASGKVIEQLLANDTKQLARLTRVHGSARERVSKELEKYIPSYHVR